MRLPKLGLILILAFLLPEGAFALSGGQLVSQAQFPSSVAFVLPKTLTQERCTATKIAPSIFLTAAHCFDRYFDDGRQPQIEFYQHEISLSGVKRVKSGSRILKGLPLIHPGYYRADSFINRFRQKQFGSNTDLAVFKVDRDVTDVPVAHLTTGAPRLGQRILIGGYGVSVFDKFGEAPGSQCVPIPCALKMAPQVITDLSDAQIYSTSSKRFSAYLLGGDSGGPAFVPTESGPAVVGINQSVTDLEIAGAPKTSRLTRIDVNYAWIKAAVQNLQRSAR
jgi:Trypsin